jgi:O-antigen ligase
VNIAAASARSTAVTFAALVLAAVLFKMLGHKGFTPLSVAVAAALLLVRPALGEASRAAVERFLLLFGLLIYALANQDPSYHEHVALLLCLVPALPRLRRVMAFTAAEGSLLVVLAVIVWSLSWSSNLSMTASGIAMSVLCLLFLIGCVLVWEGRLERVLGQVLLVLAALLVGSFVVGGMGHGAAGRTFSGVTLHRNQLGFLLGLMILLCLFAVRERLRWPHLLGGVAAAGLLAYADSKSSIVAVSLAAVVYLVIRARRWRLYLVLLAVVLGGLFASLPSPKMDHFALALGRDPTFTSRTEIWADSLRMAAQQPFTGYGYNAVWSAHENRLAQFPDAPGPRYAHAHNAWIDWLLQLGAGGLLLYWAFLAVLLGRAWQIIRQAGPPTAGGPPSDSLAARQVIALVLYIQVYDMANVSTVPVTRFGFFMLAVMSLCLWLSAEATRRQRFAAPLPARPAEPDWAAPAVPSVGRRLRQLAGIGAGAVATAAAVAAYAVWDDGREFARAEQRTAPAANGVVAVGVIEASEFQWRTPQRLHDYARRHRQALLEKLQRSDPP